jgi:transketolase
MIQEENMQRHIRVYDSNFVKWAKDKPEVVALSADLTGGCELRMFQETYPERFFSMGIAEQNMHSFAGGLASEGFIPFVHTFAVFIYRRALDQVTMSIAHPNAKVRLVGSVPGVTSPAGATHQAIDDIGIMRTVPNMTILECGDVADIESFFKLTEEIDGPVYVRMLRGEVPRLFNSPMKFNESRVVTEGKDIVLLSSGVCTEEAIRAVDALKKKGLSIKHMHVTCLKPFNDMKIMDAISDSKYGVVTIENHSVIGGLGSIVADKMAELGLPKKLYKIGIQDEYMHGGSKLYLMKRYKIDAMSVINTIENIVEETLDITEKMIEEFHFELLHDDTRSLGV